MSEVRQADLWRTLRVPRVNLLRTGLAWLKDAIRGVHLDPHWQPPEATAEVESERERYSAARYVQHQRAAMDGDFTGRREWALAIARMSPEDRQAFFDEVDMIIWSGGLVAVLTTEQIEEVRQRVLARKDEIQSDNARSMSNFGEFNAQVVHAVADDPDWQPENSGLDEDGLPAWPELDSEEWDETAEERDRDPWHGTQEEST